MKKKRAMNESSATSKQGKVPSVEKFDPLRDALYEFATMSIEDREKLAAESVRKAIAETHAAGLPSCHASDREDYKLCFLFPDGHREYFNTIEEGDAILEKHGLKR
ncbi:MAG: hypothetical protein A4E60_03212 [Syntrophorhabdus sp. PtaB.Bin047]|jgi:hypothetical protein|nr:MAG: hypothetical protein A4E60_03212 [Syntrophorhabdus sp. PtaB.Bin047]